MKKLLIITFFLIAIFVYNGFAPLREFYRFPEYKGKNDFKPQPILYDSTQKNILIVSDNNGTEIFDLLTPFYLFNATGKANVFIVAEKKYPINVMKGLFTLPHFTFKEIDSLHIVPAVIVIPALSPRAGEEQNPYLINWINSKYSDSTRILSICAGALTAAATGLYDGKPITTHALEFKGCEKQYNRPVWVRNAAVVKSGNLYSTAGVSNAVEGSLTIIQEMFGYDIVQQLKKTIGYPHKELKTEHKSQDLTTADKLTVAGKIYVKKNRNIGVLLQEGIDDFALISVLDTYHRTFPKSIKTYSINGKSVITQSNLVLMPTGNMEKLEELDELHVLLPDRLTESDKKPLAQAPLVKYQEQDKDYTINICLKRIRQQYGEKFEGLVKKLLDYN